MIYCRSYFILFVGDQIYLLKGFELFYLFFVVVVWYFNFRPTAPETLLTKDHPKNVLTQVSTDEPFHNRKPI